MKLNRMVIKDIKCFENVTINNLSDINLFIGKNNSGKSTILECLSYAHSALLPNAQIQLPEKFVRIGVTDRNPVIMLIFKLEDTEVDELVNSLFDKLDKFTAKKEDIENLFKKLLSENLFIEREITFIKNNYLSQTRGGHSLEGKLPYSTEPHGIEFGFSVVIKGRPNQIKHTPINEMLKKLIFPDIGNLTVPEFVKIPDKRNIVQSEKKSFDLLSGSGLIENLFHYDNIQNRKKRKVVKELKANYREITDEQFIFNVYQDEDTAEVKRMMIATDKKPDEELNIKDIGMGSQELMILMSNILDNRYSHIAIEEPEIHFHPEYQKRFFNFLKNHVQNHNNQFFISTHSHIYFNENTEGSSYVLQYENEKTYKCSSPIDYSDKSKIKNVLDEIGLELSDLYFYKGLFFVEGEDDAEAFNLWSRGLFKDSLSLEERGINFVIMEGARNMNYFAESKILENISAFELPYLMVIDRNEKSEKDISILKKNYKKLKVLERRELENYLISIDILISFIKEHHKAYLESVGEKNIDELFERIIEESISELKSFYKAILFIEELSNEILSGWSILKKSEYIFSIVEKEEAIDAEKLIENILKKKNREELIPKFSKFYKREYEELWKKIEDEYEKSWNEKWDLKYKINNIPGKELLKKMLKKLEEKDLHLSKKDIIDYLSIKPDLIPKEIKDIITNFSKQL